MNLNILVKVNMVPYGAFYVEAKGTQWLRSHPRWTRKNIFNNPTFVRRDIFKRIGEPYSIFYQCFRWFLLDWLGNVIL